MAVGKMLAVLLATIAVAAAQGIVTYTHSPATNPFYHPTGRPAQNAAAGASSQVSPGFPQISKLLPLVQADTIGPTLSAATTKLVVAPTWDFSNPNAAPGGFPGLLFRPNAVGVSATATTGGSPPPPVTGGRRLLATNGTGSCITNAPTLGANANQADQTACALAASINTTCACSALTGPATLGRKLLQTAAPTFSFIGRQQFFGECKEDFYRETANCNYVFDAAIAPLLTEIQTTVAGNVFQNCVLFYDDGSYVTSTTCFAPVGGAPTVVRLNAQAIEYAKNPSTAGALAPGTRISPETFLAANYISPTGFAFSVVFRPVQTFGVYINEDHQVFPGQ